MNGYKAFDKDLKCSGFQFEIGKEYKIKGELEMCRNGFHFCKTITDCYEYYPMKRSTRICEIETSSKTISAGNKYCTSKIKIVRELSKEEHKNGNLGEKNIGFCNHGNHNRGNYNEGNYNKGNYNKGNSNKGNYNEGDSNKGDSNKGNYNEGNYNEGDSNKGSYNEGSYNKGFNNKGSSNEGDANRGNSNEGFNNIGIHNKGGFNKGDYNEGNYNIGIRNKGDHQIGICNTNAPLVIFNKISKMTFKELFESGALDDIVNGNLTDKVRAIDTFDIDIWNEIFNKD